MIPTIFITFASLLLGIEANIDPSLYLTESCRVGNSFKFDCYRNGSLCIDIIKHMDGNKDCANGADEECWGSLVKCDMGLKCANPLYISTLCTDFSTNGCPGDYRCPYTTICLKSSALLNGTAECPDKSDEDPKIQNACVHGTMTCGKYSSCSWTYGVGAVCNCNTGYWNKSGKCVPDPATRFGAGNCTFAPILQFECGDGSCINYTNVRDCHLDCNDGADEACGPNQIACEHACDYQSCSDNINVKLCELDGTDIVYPNILFPIWHCSDTTKCVVNSWLLDGINDCGDWSDEDRCNSSVYTTVGAAFPCDPQATCTSYQGTHSCVCKPGYTGDGNMCDLITTTTTSTPTTTTTTPTTTSITSSTTTTPTTTSTTTTSTTTSTTTTPTTTSTTTPTTTSTTTTPTTTSTTTTPKTTSTTTTPTTTSTTTTPTTTSTTTTPTTTYTTTTQTTTSTTTTPTATSTTPTPTTTSTTTTPTTTSTTTTPTTTSTTTTPTTTSTTTTPTTTSTTTTPTTTSTTTTPTTTSTTTTPTTTSTTTTPTTTTPTTTSTTTTSTTTTPTTTSTTTTPTTTSTTTTPTTTSTTTAPTATSTTTATTTTSPTTATTTTAPQTTSTTTTPSATSTTATPTTAAITTISTATLPPTTTTTTSTVTTTPTTSTTTTSTQAASSPTTTISTWTTTNPTTTCSVVCTGPVPATQPPLFASGPALKDVVRGPALIGLASRGNKNGSGSS